MMFAELLLQVDKDGSKAGPGLLLLAVAPEQFDDAGAGHRPPFGGENGEKGSPLLAPECDLLIPVEQADAAAAAERQARFFSICLTPTVTRQQLCPCRRCRRGGHS